MRGCDLPAGFDLSEVATDSDADEQINRSVKMKLTEPRQLDDLVLVLMNGICLHEMGEDEAAARQYCREVCARDGISENFDEAWREVRSLVFGREHVEILP